MKITTPDPLLVSQYLQEIAKAYQVDWTDPRLQEQVIIPTKEQQEPIHIVHEPLSIVEKPKLMDQIPLEPTEAFPKIPLQQNQPTASAAEPDFDELEKRFEALKKKK